MPVPLSITPLSIEVIWYALEGSVIEILLSTISGGSCSCQPFLGIQLMQSLLSN